ncbi:MAG TPA: Rv2231c family pyridoxal phosphate-dependent protein CobC, partial [Propionibacteriaceae bacterium]|nr:Rv2231c family pyridoxal phosphate-dependent protein CobC [Propionibacteriaceae bacterium]
LMGALRGEGLEVAGFKVGPDYIDPGYHALATGRPGRNLDPHLCHPEQMAPLLLHGAQTPTPADVAVIEGVMGLFDGQIGGDGFASTAHVATLINAPVILVLDIAQVSRTAAAIVHGLHTFDPAVRLSGVILNKAGSARHADEIVAAMEATGLPVLGVLPRDAGIEAPSRHLGLVPAAERSAAAEAVARLSAQVAEHINLTDVLAIAYAAPPVSATPWSPTDVVTPPSAARPVVAIAAGRAFTFRYAETDELLRAAGCEPIPFDPLIDPALPPGTAGLYLGGGFPEVHAVELSGNGVLREELRRAIAGGLPTVAECAGLLYLCRTVDGAAMVGAIDAEATMTSRLTLRYRTPVADHDHLLAAAGARVTGHEFHRTVVEPSAGASAAWLVDGTPSGFAADPAGLGAETLHASYLHLHWAGHPRLAQRFADAVHGYALRQAQGATPARRQAQGPSADLRYHGDQDIADGLVDLAVNVRIPAPPAWLQTVIDQTTPGLASYPRSDEAAKAIAAAHRVDLDQVLPTAGGAEAFTLLARARPPRRPVIIHPQFTEPEAALIAAGHPPERVILDARTGFHLDPTLIPSDADLVMIGNPTNPTSTLHPADLLRTLVRPGRLLVVDEAFMDAVPGEPETMISPDLRGVLVLRSLTKTWGLAGLRAGYAVGDAEVIAAMAVQQPPWSVSTPALAAITACLSDQARDLAAAAAAEITRHRGVLVAGLQSIGLAAAGQPMAPFVLVDTEPIRGGHVRGWVRTALRDEGFAVRRGETFPGLGPDWIRIAVRDPSTSGRLVRALHRLTVAGLNFSEPAVIVDDGRRGR